MNYIPLHIYTGYTFLSSCLKVEDLISICKKNSYNAIGISDYQNLYAYPTFYHSCKKNGIKPIFGLSLSINYNNEPFYLSLFVKNEEGYRNLCSLIYNLNKLSLDDLSKYSNGLICVLPCKSNNYVYNAFKNNDDSIVGLVFKLQKNYSDFYLGIELYQKEDKDVMKKVRTFASSHSYKCIAFPKHLYESKNDALTLKILNAIRKDEKLSSNVDKTGPYYFLGDFATNTLYTKDEILESHNLVDLISFEFDQKRGTLLEYPASNSAILDKKKFILFKCRENMASKGITLTDTYIERLNHELDIIESMGYLDYFLIVADYVNEAKKRQIPVGPGRGSAVGALVAYCLGITEIDPMKYNLFFERFLNPGRTSMPDIDVDFADYRRNEVIDYIGNKYGNDKMSYIIAFQTIGAKQAIRDIGRVLSYNSVDISTLSNAIRKTNNNYTLEECRKAYPEFDKLCNDSYFAKIYNLAKKIEGFPRQQGLHAAGIILNNEPLENVIPTSVRPDGKLVCQYEKDYLEEQGFLKMDILALRDLSIIESITRRINARGVNFKLSSIPLDDNKTFLTLNAGLTQGIFQLEQEGISRALKEVKMNCFDDIVALIALYRPGPMQFISTYADNKNNNKAITYLHPCLEPILKPTYGVIIYQEQIMQIAQVVASFSLQEADLFRRAISKKDESKLNNLKESFINGALKNNFSLEIANSIFDMINKFANYGFNKSHSVAYALISYQMAYLKAHFPAEYFSSLLDYQVLSDDKYAKYLNELNLSQISLCIPSINESELNYKVKDDKIIIPLSGIKGLPIDLAEAIVFERNQNGKYKDFIDFNRRIIGYRFNLTHIITLINAGAFDSFAYNRASLRKASSIVYEYAKNTSNGMSLLSEDEALLLLPVINVVPEDIDLKYEKEIETLGILLSGSLFEKYSDHMNRLKIKPINEVINNKYTLNLGLIITNIKVLQTKKKETMAILTGFDGNTSISVIVFSDVYDRDKLKIEKGKPLNINGYFKNDDIRGISFIAKSIDLLEENK